MAHIGNKYKLLRQQLDELGYKQVLLPECIPLVEKLLSDFIQTTESLEKYMTIAKNAIEVTVTPFKQTTISRVIFHFLKRHMTGT